MQSNRRHIIISCRIRTKQQRNGPWPIGVPPGNANGTWTGSLPVWDIFQDVLHPAVQNLAQGVQRGGGNGPAVFHAVECVGGHPLFENEVVFRQPFAVQCLVKRTVADHLYHQNTDYHAQYIDYTLSLEYNAVIAELFLYPGSFCKRYDFIIKERVK